MIIQSLRLNPFDPFSIGVEWEVSGPSGAFSFFVERSENPENGWTTLNDVGISSAFGYIDRTVNREAFDRNLYYRIKAIDKVEFTSEYSSVVSVLETDGTSIGRYIAKQEKLLLRRFNGKKTAVFIRKTFGERCDKCYDKVRGKCITDNCSVCFGTTFKGGYFQPILIDVNFNPRQKGQDKNVLQRNDNNQVMAWASNYPVLSPEDLLVDIEKTNARYLVKTVDPTENGGATVKQTLGLIRVHPSAPQFMIPQEMNIHSINDVNVYRRD